MWDKQSFEWIIKKVPFSVKVNWNKSPSAEKYGRVNTLLTMITILHEYSAKFINYEKEEISKFELVVLPRRLTDRHKRNFTIVGHGTGCPLLFAVINDLTFEIYFNYHFLIETKTGYHQYYPSASVILRCINFLQGAFMSSPGSWGSDIIFISFNMDGTFICETSSSYLPTKIRKNFKGFKYLPVRYKYFITSRNISRSEKKFLQNNGFELLICNSIESLYFNLSKKLDNFLEKQKLRMVNKSNKPLQWIDNTARR